MLRIALLVLVATTGAASAQQTTTFLGPNGQITNITPLGGGTYSVTQTPGITPLLQTPDIQPPQPTYQLRRNPGGLIDRMFGR
jgi:hypothetical protein